MTTLKFENLSKNAIDYILEIITGCLNDSQHEEKEYRSITNKDIKDIWS